MSFPADIAQATLDTLIAPLALLFLAGACGDIAAARFAASQMLSAFNAETPDELGLAAEVVSLQMHVLKALGDSSEPDLSLNQILRLRGGAVSLSRASHSARHELEQLQRARRAGITVQPAEAASQAAPDQPSPVQPAPAKPRIDSALDLIEAARDALQTAKKTGGRTWSQSFQKRETAKRITENLRKKQAEHARMAAHVQAAAGGGEVSVAAG
jgi:hypothetical protein